MTRIVILPDIQVPYHDRKALAAMTEFIRRTKPDELHQIGDLIDAPQPSRWNKGLAGEYAGDLQDHLDETKRVLGELRAALGKGKPFKVKVGNHDRRIADYVYRYAPALGPLGALSLDALLDTAAHGVELVPRPYAIAPGWVAAHGDESGLRSTAGLTALALARKLGQSVVCGHTHRAALVPHTTGVAGKTSTIFGMEVGNVMDMAKAQYLTAGGADWQQAFGILDVDGTRVHPQLVFVNKGQFRVNGVTYGGAK